MKTPTVIFAVVSVHVVAVSAFFLAQGCGTTRSVSGQPPEVVMPPVPPPVTRTVIPPTPRHPARPPVTHTSETKTYVIAKGDTLSQICSRLGVSQGEVMRLNNIKNPNLIRVGQKLLLPGGVNVEKIQKPVSKPEPKVPAGAGTYVVVKGDSLSVIAHRHGTTVAALRKANGISGDIIRVGQKLVIPGAETAKPVSTEPAGSSEQKPETVLLPQPDVTDLMDMPAEEPPAATVPSEPRTPGKFKDYTVSANEDLYSVAMQWGVSVAELKEINGLADTDLNPGQVIKIPLD